MLRTAFLAALIALACDAAAPALVRSPADSATGEIRFRLAGLNDAAILVPVHINGQGPFQFVVDTGATITCVDAALAQRLALEPEAGRLGFGLDANRPGRVQLVRIDSIRVGTAHAVDLAGCVLDLAHIQQAGLEVDGLLGLNFLKEFRVSFDFEREMLLLQERDGATHDR
jgi:clan AA aspartic protease (TIGR02281 family)